MALAQGAACTCSPDPRRPAAARDSAPPRRAGRRRPRTLDAAILFAPAGELVPPALAALDRGGTLAVAGIHLSEIPPLDYQRHLFQERHLRSVTANTRGDGAILGLAARLRLEVTTTPIRSTRPTAYSRISPTTGSSVRRSWWPENIHGQVRHSWVTVAVLPVGQLWSWGQGQIPTRRLRRAPYPLGLEVPGDRAARGPVCGGAVPGPSALPAPTRRGGRWVEARTRRSPWPSSTRGRGSNT